MKIFVAEKSEETFNNIVSSLSDFEEVEVQGETNYSVHVLNKIFEFNPDVIVTDLRLPGNSELEFLRTIKKIQPKALIIVFSNIPNDKLRAQFLKEGATMVVDRDKEFEYLKIVLGKLGTDGKDADLSENF